MNMKGLLMKQVILIGKIKRSRIGNRPNSSTQIYEIKHKVTFRMRIDCLKQIITRLLKATF